MSETPNNDQPADNPQMLCPRWMCFTFDNFLRRLAQNPQRILKPYIKSGWTVLDVGPGVGYFTLPLARLVGDKGKVIAADLQEAMLATIHHRAVKAGLDARITLHRAQEDRIGVSEPVDFCLAFWMVHEVPDRTHFLAEIFADLKPGGLFLLVEPMIHVPRASFDTTAKIAKSAGFLPVSEPKIFLSYSLLLQK
ncbi:MAG: class I SAM-dependent methyltransferase [Dehalococcoidales bacterium]